MDFVKTVTQISSKVDESREIMMDVADVEDAVAEVAAAIAMTSILVEFRSKAVLILMESPRLTFHHLATTLNKQINHGVHQLETPNGTTRRRVKRLPRQKRKTRVLPVVGIPPISLPSREQ